MTLHAKDKWGDGKALEADCAGRLKIINDDGMAIAVMTLKDKPLLVKSAPRDILDLSANNVQAVGAAAAWYDLPHPGSRYIMIASGGTCWVREDAAAVVDARGGVCPDGVPIGPFTIRGPRISCIAAGANRHLYFIEVLD